VQALRRLPGVGVKSASRMAFTCCSTTAKARRAVPGTAPGGAPGAPLQLVPYLHRSEVCSTCLDPQRDRSKLCVVETPADQSALERTAPTKGLYFVLMGKLSPLDGIGPATSGCKSCLTAPPTARARGDSGHQFHRRGRSHGPCDRRGAQGNAACGSRGWRAACPRAASWNMWIWAPLPMRWWTGDRP
jgi:hypothetical protein